MPRLTTDQTAELASLSRDIHAHPELAYEERHAVAAISAVLERAGHRVERGIGGLETAFRARVGPADGPAVALLAEYDALPEVGHGCGHNLIAISNVGAYLIAAANAARLEVAVELIGTPAEENGGGKIDLLRKGVFDRTVAALSSHPAGQGGWAVSGTGLGVVGKRVTFTGVAAHAGSAPEKGRNALNAVIRFFVGIDGWRQQLEVDSRVHGYISDGGTDECRARASRGDLWASRKGARDARRHGSEVRGDRKRCGASHRYKRRDRRISSLLRAGEGESR